MDIDYGTHIRDIINDNIMRFLFLHFRSEHWTLNVRQNLKPKSHQAREKKRRTPAASIANDEIIETKTKPKPDMKFYSMQMFSFAICIWHFGLSIAISRPICIWRRQRYGKRTVLFWFVCYMVVWVPSLTANIGYIYSWFWCVRCMGPYKWMHVIQKYTNIRTATVIISCVLAVLILLKCRHEHDIFVLLLNLFLIYTCAYTNVWCNGILGSHIHVPSGNVTKNEKNNEYENK